MRIALGSDHAGYPLKKEILDFLSTKGVEYQDFGCFSEERVDYIDFGEKAAQKVVSGEFDRAILVCGTGLGMGYVANKFKGIRAAPCWNEYTAEMSRAHNNANCLTLGGRVIPRDEALKIVEVWLDTEFEGGRHEKRVNKIIQIEERNFK